MSVERQHEKVALLSVLKHSLKLKLKSHNEIINQLNITDINMYLRYVSYPMQRIYYEGLQMTSHSPTTGVLLFPPGILSKMPSVTLKDVDQQKFVKAFAAFLKKTGKMRVPEWVDIVKTAKFKELAPYDPDWYYIRCAALVRHIYIRSPIGVGAVTKIFGGRKRNGTHPSHFCRSASGVARKALQSLEQLKLIEKAPLGDAN